MSTPLFLSVDEKQAIKAATAKTPVGPFYWALMQRVAKRASSPGLMNIETTVEWWHCVTEYVTDAAMAWALKQDDVIGAWLRDVTLSIARRPLEDWVGPAFRNHGTNPPQGHLETAHVCWAVAGALDLAADVFTDTERDELANALRTKGLSLCRNWLASRTSFNNWRTILNGGLAVTAAVLHDRDAMAEAAEEFTKLCGLWQDDGSYGESLQYSNYAAFGQMMTAEALIRRDPAYADQLDLSPWTRKARWDAASYFYRKPLSGWGSTPRPRCANFNDSSAIHRPNAEVLLQSASRMKDKMPTEAGLCRWLCDQHYSGAENVGPWDRSSFGLRPHFGFLTLPLIVNACDPITPTEAGLGTTEAFSCGDVLARDAWDGRTVLAVHGGGDPLNAPSHLHGDLNSFILVHNRERLLVDPGHSCYRNLTRGLEASSQTHNTCTFQVEEAPDDLRQEDALRMAMLDQKSTGRRTCQPDGPTPPLDRGARRLLVAEDGPLRVIASDAAGLYGPAIEQFARTWLLCGSHVLFVVDRIASSVPSWTTWHWLLNNRDQQLDLKLVRPDRLVARRGEAGMKLFHLGQSNMQGPVYSMVHDAYHPLPASLGENAPGSGMLMRWREHEAATQRTVVHAIAMDHAGSVAGWHLHTDEDAIVLEAPGGKSTWSLKVSDDTLQLIGDDRTWQIACGNTWSLEG